MEVVPRESWEALFKSQGMKNPIPRMQMLDGFNEGWIEFERGDSGSEKGSVPLETGTKGPGQTRGQVSLNLTDFDNSLLKFFRESPSA